MVTRCTTCGRAYLEIDARRVAAVRPRCVSCLVDDIETAADIRADIAAAAAELQCIAAVPVSWYRARGKR